MHEIIDAASALTVNVESFSASDASRVERLEAADDARQSIYRIVKLAARSAGARCQLAISPASSPRLIDDPVERPTAVLFGSQPGIAFGSPREELDKKAWTRPLPGPGLSGTLIFTHFATGCGSATVSPDAKHGMQLCILEVNGLGGQDVVNAALEHSPQAEQAPNRTV